MMIVFWIGKVTFKIMNSFDTIIQSSMSGIDILLNEAMNQKSMNLPILMYLNDIHVSIVIEFLYICLFSRARSCCRPSFFSIEQQVSLSLLFHFL